MFLSFPGLLARVFLAVALDVLFELALILLCLKALLFLHLNLVGRLAFLFLPGL